MTIQVAQVDSVASHVIAKVADHSVHQGGVPFADFLGDAVSQYDGAHDVGAAQRESQVALNRLTNGLVQPVDANEMAATVAQALPLERERRDRWPADELGVEMAQVDAAVPLANATPLQAGEAFQTGRLAVTPFQLFMDRAVDSLRNVGQYEAYTNDLMERFVKGEVSVDEVAMAASQLNLMVSFATTVITTATSTFKEIQQLQV